MSSNTVIGTNTSALTAHRYLGAVGDDQSTASERLSSGLKINSAADDAAGLAISQKMKAQIRGLDMAEKNSEDAISLVQTAEGSISEMQSMLQRMRELSVQAANDTNTTEERTKMANEMIELIDEIDSMASRTEFNGQALIDGNFSGYFQIGANSGQKINISMEEINAETLGDESIIDERTAQQAIVGAFTINSDGTYTDATADSDLSAVLETISGELTDALDGETFTYNNVKETLEELITNVNVLIDGGEFTGDVAIDGETIEEVTAASCDGVADALTDLSDVLTQLSSYLEAADGASATDNSDALQTALAYLNGEVASASDIAVSAVNAQSTSLEEMRTMLEGFVANSDEIDLDYGSFTVFLENIDVALSQISDTRAKLGATQNRLEYTINNLQISSENLSAANSRIEDADMAEEMMNLTQANVLQQAAISMLAQANAQPESILQLLS